MGAGQSRPPVGTCGANKRAVQVCMSLHSPKAHKPIFQRISLVKGEESLYNGYGAVLLLCGRRFLLHRGVGCSRTSRPALIIRLDAILAHIPLECKRFFRTLRCPGRFFCCSECDGMVVGGWVARHGRGRGACRGRLQGGVNGWFRSIAIPRRGLVVTCRHVPAGIAVAFTPCGA